MISRSNFLDFKSIIMESIPLIILCYQGSQYLFGCSLICSLHNSTRADPGVRGGWWKSFIFSLTKSRNRSEKNPCFELVAGI